MILNNLFNMKADFGESIPFDATFFNKSVSSFESHNSYPEKWAILNEEVLQEANKLNDTFFFMRSGNQYSPKHVTSFWAGVNH